MEKESLLCMLRAKLEQLGPGGQISIRGKQSDAAQSLHPVTWARTRSLSLEMEKLDNHKSKRKTVRAPPAGACHTSYDITHLF